MTDVALPVPLDRWLTALTSEASSLVASGRAMPDARPDLVQSGALGYLRALARPLDRAGRDVEHRHAHAMTAARWAMLDFLRDGEAPPADRVRPTAPPLRGNPRTVEDLPRSVRRQLARLPALTQRVVRLSLQGRGVPEIAPLVGLSENAVAVRKCRALKMLRSSVRRCPNPSIMTGGSHSTLSESRRPAGVNAVATARTSAAILAR